MKTVFTQGKMRYREVWWPGRKGIKNLYAKYYWIRDRRQLLHKGRKP